MTMIDADRESLIQYRLKQAEDTISEVELLLEHGKFRAAMNRMYYGMFYSVSALGLRYGFTTSKHTQLIGWFNKTFIKDERLARKYGKMISEIFELRNQGDYDAYIEFTEDDVRQRYAEMQEFIAVVAHEIRSEEEREG